MMQPAGQTEAITITPGPTLAGSRCQEIREELRQHLAAGHTNLIVDLAGTAEISPSGIYLLLAAHHSLLAKAGGLELVNLTDDLRQLLIGLHLEEELGLNA